MEKWIEEAAPYLLGVAAIIGILVVEYLYMTNAEKVRFKFVIMLLPVGAIVGVVVGAIVAGVTVLLLGLSIYAAIAFVAISALVFVWNLIYGIVLWEN